MRSGLAFSYHTAGRTVLHRLYRHTSRLPPNPRWTHRNPLSPYRVLLPRSLLHQTAPSHSRIRTVFFSSPLLPRNGAGTAAIVKITSCTLQEPGVCDVRLGIRCLGALLSSTPTTPVTGLHTTVLSSARENPMKRGI